MNFSKYKIDVQSTGFRIFSVFMMLFSLLTVSFAYLGIQSLQNSIIANASSELRVLSAVLARQVRRHLMKLEDHMTELASSKVLIENLKQAEPNKEVIINLINDKFQGIFATNSMFESFALFDLQGQSMIATEQVWYDLNLSQQPFFERSLLDFGLSEIVFENHDRWQIAFQPVMYNGKVLAILATQINMQSITDQISERIAFLETTHAYLTDASYHRISPLDLDFVKDLRERSGTGGLNDVFLRHIGNEFWIESYDSSDGRRVLGAALRISRYEWSLIIERGFDEILEPLENLKKIVLFAAIATILVLGLVTFYISRSLTKSLRRLVNDTKKIAHGDFSHQIIATAKIREVQFLAREIEKMRRKIWDFQHQMLQRLETSERQRIANERLASIGTLAAGLAHEIRNPLNAMTLLLSRLELANPSKELLNSVAANIRGEIARLERLVSAILDYAKPIHLNLKAFDLVKVMNQVLELYKPILEAGEIRHSIFYAEKSLEITADQDQIKQCMVNLLQNAIDACGPKGKIEIQLERSQNSVTVSIEDNGPGLLKGSSDKLFDLFYTTKEKGNGLGLSMVKKILDAHNGQIEFENSIYGSSSGFRIWFTLPLNFPNCEKIQGNFLNFENNAPREIYLTQ